jgi:predicted nucleic acid-binding protein
MPDVDKMSDQSSKPRIYLDTLVISLLYAPEAPLRMADTWQLWAAIRAGEYDVFISTTVTDELEAAPEPKQSQMLNEIRLAGIVTLKISDDVRRLAAEYVQAGILNAKHYNDCEHIAVALAHGCGALVSWNFSHLVKARTIDGANAVNKNNQYGEIAIVTPAILLERRATT